MTTLLQAAPAGAGWMNVALIVVMVANFYFFMIRPQQKKQKEINNFRNALTPGQDVVTIGGIHGTIKHIDGDIITLKIATGVEIKIEKAAISPNASNIAQAS